MAGSPRPARALRPPPSPSGTLPAVQCRDHAAEITVLKTNATAAWAATVQRISRDITVTYVVPNVAMTDRTTYT